MGRANRFKPARRSAARASIIDRLEPRVVLANVNWVGPAVGDWDVAANWFDGSTNHVPTASDRAFISGNFTVNCNTATARVVAELFVFDATLNVSAGTLTTNGGGFLSAGAFNVGAGTIVNNGSLTVSSTNMTWSGGTLAGIGSIHISNTPNSQLNITGTSSKTLSTTLQNQNLINWTDGELRLDQGKIVNLANFNAAPNPITGIGSLENNRIENAGTFSYSAAGNMNVSGLRFVNTGSIAGGGNVTFISGFVDWSAGLMAGAGRTIVEEGAVLNAFGGELISSRPFDNEGIVNVFSSSGNATTLRFTNGGNHSGEFNLLGPGTRIISFEGADHSYTAAATFAGDGEVHFVGGNHALAAQFDGLRRIAVTSAASATFSAAPDDTELLSISSGGNALLDVAATFDSIDLNGGSLGGTGDITCTGIFDWADGTLPGTANLTIAAGATFDVACAAKNTNRPLVVAGAMASSADLTFGALVNIAGSATIDADVTFLAAVELGELATLTLLPHGINPEPHVLRATGVLIPPGATLNQNDNVVIVDYTKGRSQTLTVIEGLIWAARNGGAWNQPGLTSRAARNEFLRNTTLAAIDASDYIPIYGSTFAGQSIDPTTVLVKYTYYGDADFNGKVDGADYARIDSQFNQQTTQGNIGGWFNGDFDYNGKIDGADFALIDGTISSQSPRAVAFTNHIAFGTGVLPHTSVSADLNKDGKLDLIATNEGGTSISILRNTTAQFATTPSFANAQTVQAGVLPVSVTAVDLNNDQKLDLAVSNAGPPFQLLVLLNTTPNLAPTFSFSSPQYISTGARPRFVIASDINADGRPDLTTANFWNNTLSVFLNQTNTNATSASFAPRKDFANASPGPLDPVSLSAADYNSDTRIDLVVANEMSSTISVFLNTTPVLGAEAFFAAPVSYPAGPTPRFVTSADFNGDDAPDLAVANHGADALNNSISLFLNNGNGTFAPRRDVDLRGAVRGPIGLAVGDVNGDTRPDLAVSNFNSDNITILLNTTLTPATLFFGGETNLQVGLNPIFVNLADLNGDGDDDLAVADYSQGALSVLINLNDDLPDVDFTDGRSPSLRALATVNVSGHAAGYLTLNAARFSAERIDASSLVDEYDWINGAAGSLQ